MKEPVSFFLPVRKGSERVINKNTKTFAGIEGGILALKLQQLKTSTQIDEIILSTNDEVSIAVAEKFLMNDSRLRIIERPQHLCESSTILTDLIAYVHTIVSTEHIAWGHVTTPMADAGIYDEGIKAYFEGISNGYDSLMSVTPFQNFLLNEKAEMVNRINEHLKWPRTQDLQQLYEVNSMLFIASKSVYKEKKDRIGEAPLLWTTNKIHALDVDWEEDFLIAEAVYEKIGRS